MKSTFKFFIILTCTLMVAGLWSVPVYSAEYIGDEAINGICISLKVGSSQSLVNGEPATLKNEPFLENDIAYVPLREIVELCDGIVKYIPSDSSVIIALKKKGDNEKTFFSQIWVGKHKILNMEDGWKDISADNISVPKYLFPVDEDYIPVLRNGCVFVPVDFFMRFGFAYVKWNPESGRIIILNLEENLGIGGIQLGNDFDLLDEDIKNRFRATGRVNYEFTSHKEEVFSDGNMEITLWTRTDTQNTYY